MTTHRSSNDGRSGTRRHRFGTDERGAAAVELALVAPVLFLLLFGIVEFGIAAYAWSTATDGARFGARFAAVRSTTSGRPTTPTQIRDTVRARLASPGLIVGVEYRNRAGTGTGTDSVGHRVRVTVSYPYTMLYRFIPTGNISSRAEMVVVY